MTARLSPISRVVPQLMASATLTVETGGAGFVEITRDIHQFLRQLGVGQGMLVVYLRHTSASLVIQENADPDVQVDLLAALERLAPEHAGWIHRIEGPDDMPAHIKSMLNGVSLSIPVHDGAPVLGIWQGIYLAEHRRAPHRREIALQYIGTATGERPADQ
jgi:secondary thiamine-phosphate synthase enzyme